MIHPERYDSLGEILADAFVQYKTDEALVEVERSRESARYTYAEARGASDRVAAWLTERGLEPGDRVGIVATNQAAWLLCAAGVLHAGLVVVPLDARLTAHEQATLLAHADVRAVVVDDHLWRKLSDRLSPTVPHVIVVSARKPPAAGAVRFEDLPDAEAPPPLVPRTRDDVAAVVYSSGTGGDPKGCMLTHGNYLAQYGSLTRSFVWARGDRYLSILPTNHAIDFMCGFLASWCTGGTVVHQRTLRPEHIMATLKRYRITQMAVVPLILEAFRRALTERLDEAPEGRRRVVGALSKLNRRLTERAPNQALSRWLLKPVHDAFGGHLRTLYCGGAFTDRSLADFFYDLGLPVAIGYGLTEACTVVTVNDLKPYRGDSVGAAVDGVQVRIVEPGPDGVGEVQVRGPTVFKGYLHDPEQTEAAFDGDWLRTGDLGWLDGAHHLHLVGRRKNLIVTAGGKNVYPEDIEGFFAEVPAEELAVFAEDYVWPRRGMTDEGLVAVVRPREDAQRWLAELQRHNHRLPDFKRVRSVLVCDEPFPRTASLKVKRDELAQHLRATTSRDDLLQVST